MTCVHCGLRSGPPGEPGSAVGGTRRGEAGTAADPVAGAGGRAEPAGAGCRDGRVPEHARVRPGLTLRTASGRSPGDGDHRSAPAEAAVPIEGAVNLPVAVRSHPCRPVRVAVRGPDGRDDVHVPAPPPARGGATAPPRPGRGGLAAVLLRAADRRVPAHRRRRRGAHGTARQAAQTSQDPARVRQGVGPPPGRHRRLRLPARTGGGLVVLAAAGRLRDVRDAPSAHVEGRRGTVVRPAHDGVAARPRSQRASPGRSAGSEGGAVSACGPHPRNRGSARGRGPRWPRRAQDASPRRARRPAPPVRGRGRTR